MLGRIRYFYLTYKYPKLFEPYTTMTTFISTSRLSSYQHILKITDSNQILRAYYWNIALSGSIYPLIQTLEITLRNAIDQAVKQHHQPIPQYQKPSFKNDPYWFEKILYSVQDAKISRMNAGKKSKWIDAQGVRIRFTAGEEAVNKARQDVSRCRTQVHAGDILSRMTFGFWTTFLSKDFQNTLTHHLLWPNLLSKVFPNAPSGTSRSDIEQQFTFVREFRNRLSHHEPVWKFYTTLPNGQLDYAHPIYGLNPSLHLLQIQYDKMLTLIKWMSIDAYQQFCDAKMDHEFRKLCSLDGFYGYVDREKIGKKLPASKTKREFFKLVECLQHHHVMYMKTQNKRGYDLGINEPQLP